ncbi:VWA domain-containing protein [Cesiribacter sp. SM1]|uniref:vWA domain-containing protein n=1 Tax=Cesiribacter sp. SM1 TaxID=2861196 RepID=UPI001CD731AB|nr:VWA domain-containing protein [Cesiribacter sp. SM1]
MNWYKNFGTYEIALILLFGIGYLLYAYRFYKASQVVEGKTNIFLVKFILRTLIFALLLMAWLGPTFGQAKREIKAVGKDIFIAVDLSKSMNAYDVQPSRLEKVKFELKKMLNAFSSDRVGIIIFGTEAFIQSPLTFDGSALQLFVETLHTGLVPYGGTELAAPLQLALDKLKKEGTQEGKPSSRLVILISDGEDFGEEAQALANEYKKEGIRLFTLGVGTQEGSRIRERRLYKRNNEGEEVITRLNPDALKRLAQEANGSYYEINNRLNETQKLINAVAAVEGEMQDARLVDVSSNRYYYFLAAALLLLALDAMLHLKLLRL